LYCKDLSSDKEPIVLRTFPFSSEEYTTHSVQLFPGTEELGILSQKMPSAIRFARVRAADGKQFQNPFRLIAAKQSMTVFAANDDGAMVAIGADEGDKASEHVLEIWGTKASKQLFRLNVPQGSFSAAAFDPKGPSLATGNLDGTVRVWDTMTGKIVASISEDAAVSFVSFHPRERFLAYTTYEKKSANCKIVNVDTGKAQSQFNVDSKGASIVRFSRDGGKLATVGGDFTIRVWNVKDILPTK
jgi:WD40 repeat protein